MKRVKYLLLSICVLATLYVLGAEIWKTKPEASYVDFTGKSLIGKVHGKISGINATVKFSKNDLANSSFTATINPANLNTDNKKRDDHLKSADFLDVEKYPTIKFTSKKIEQSGKGYAVTGSLTIKDVTKEISFPFTFEEQGATGTFRGSFDINRQEYHVGEDSRLAKDGVNISIVAVVEKGK